ncbi:MAG: hypothetical protein R6W78_01075 [Bacteroidales bacterium]
MGAGWIIIIFLLLFLGYLLFFPVLIRLNTVTNHFYAGLPGIAGIRAFKKDGAWKSYYYIFFLKYSFDFSSPGTKKAEYLSNKNKSTKKRKPLNIYVLPKLVSRVLSGFKIKKFVWRIDTGDYPLNAQLIPVAACLSGTGVSVTINFSNINELYIIATTRLFRLLFTFIRFYMFNR